MNNIALATRYIQEAGSILITAGAGMGVDSGLPDFRGNTGFWNAYPALGKKGLKFDEIADPINFKSNPKTAWGFYGHRLNLYRDTKPHSGFNLLGIFCSELPGDYFVYTSNVDGQFQKAHFPEDKIYECHGSIHHLQCSGTNCNKIWSAKKLTIITDDVNCECTSEIPRCPSCGKVARPNILMFNDKSWLPDRSFEQRERYNKFLDNANNLVIVEIGAGSTIPTVRRQSEYNNAPLIRINPREFSIGNKEGVEISYGAKKAINYMLGHFLTNKTKQLIAAERE